MRSYPRRSRPTVPRRGDLLVEFAFVSLILYLLLAGIIDFGRALYSAQVLQQAADSAARELSRTPLPPTGTLTGKNGVLSTNAAAQQIYSEDYLVVPISVLPSGQTVVQSTGQSVPDYFAAKAPLLNKLLMPLMIYDPVPIAGNPVPQYFRYPGQLVPSNTTASGLTVVIPLVNYSGGTDSVLQVIPVVEEITQDPSASSPTYDFTNPNPNFSPFNLLATNVNPPSLRGMIALRINYPFQAATLVSYQGGTNGPSSQQVTNGVPTTTTEGGPVGPYGGNSGLGVLYALGKEVRPFRRVLSAQAIFRREVFE